MINKQGAWSKAPRDDISLILYLHCLGALWGMFSSSLTVWSNPQPRATTEIPMLQLLQLNLVNNTLIFKIRLPEGFWFCSTPSGPEPFGSHEQ